MMPFGAGLETSLRIGEDIGAKGGRTAWLAASYPMRIFSHWWAIRRCLWT